MYEDDSILFGQSKLDNIASITLSQYKISMIYDDATAFVR